MEAKKIRQSENYLVYENGLVYSLYKNNFMKPVIGEKGYCQVTLTENKRQFVVKIHRLIAEAFIPNPENKPQVNHINGIKTDNRVENLEWVTSSENLFHAHRIGIKKPSKHQAEVVGKLMSKKVINLKTGKIYDSAKIASEEFKININTLHGYLLGNRKNKTDLAYLK